MVKNIKGQVRLILGFTNLLCVEIISPVFSHILCPSVRKKTFRAPQPPALDFIITRRSRWLSQIFLNLSCVCNPLQYCLYSLYVTFLFDCRPNFLLLYCNSISYNPFALESSEYHDFNQLSCSLNITSYFQNTSQE